MNIAERAGAIVSKVAFVGSVGRQADPQIMPASGFQRAKLRHSLLLTLSDLAVERPADYVPLLLRREPYEVDGVT